MVFSPVSLPPGSIVKLYASVPVVLYIVFSVPKTLANNPGQKSGQNTRQKSGPKPMHADHVLKTQLHILFVLLTCLKLCVSFICLKEFGLFTLLSSQPWGCARPEVGVEARFGPGSLKPQFFLSYCVLQCFY